MSTMSEKKKTYRFTFRVKFAIQQDRIDKPTNNKTTQNSKQRMIFGVNKVMSYLPRSKHKSVFESLGEEWPCKLPQGQSVSRQ